MPDTIVVNITEVVEEVVIHITKTDSVPRGGTAGQLLAKVDNQDYRTQWQDPIPVGGAVDSVTGTANRIVLTGTAENPVVNIDPAYDQAILDAIAAAIDDIPPSSSSDSVVLFFGTAVFNPADSLTYYFGQSLVSAHPPYNSLVLGKADAINVPKTGAVKYFYLKIIIWNTVGSNENATLKLNVLDSTGAIVSTTTISTTIKFNVNPTILWLGYEIPGLNIAVTKGDYLLPQIDTPVLATNPVNVYFQGHIVIE